jgi:hypothetical protein
MKRVLTIAALCSLLAVPLYATEIFWDQSQPADSTITDKDFKFKYGDFKRAKSLGQMDIYDSGERMSLDDETEVEAQPAAPAPTRSRDVIDLPQTAPSARTQPAPAAPTRRVRSTVEPAQRDLAPSQVEPAVQPDTATVRPLLPDETRKPVPVPAIAEEPAKTEPKRLPWGQTEPKADNGGTATKFKWGERPTK